MRRTLRLAGAACLSGLGAPSVFAGELAPGQYIIEAGDGLDADGPVDIVLTRDGAFALILHAASGNVSYYDTQTRATVAAVDVGTAPRDIELTPDGRFALVTDRAADALVVLDIATREIVAQVPVGADPVMVRASADSHFAFVAGFESQSLTRVDLATFTATRPANGFPVSVALGQGTSQGYLQLFHEFRLAGGDSLAVIPDSFGVHFFDTLTLEPVDVFEASTARSVVVAPDGATIGVKHGVDEDEMRYTRLDVFTREILSESVYGGDAGDGIAHVPGPLGNYAYLDADNGVARANLVTGAVDIVTAAPSPWSLAADSSGRWLVSSGGELVVLDAESLLPVAELGASFPFGYAEMSVSSTSDEAVVLQRFGQERVVHFTVNGTNSEVLANVPTGPGVEGDGPHHVAVAGDGSFALVTHDASKNIALVDLSTRRIVTHVEAGGLLQGIELSPDGSTAVVLRYDADSAFEVAVLNVAEMAFEAVLKVDKLPLGVRFTSDGSQAIVIGTGQGPYDTGAIYFIDVDGPKSVLRGRTAAGRFAYAPELFEFELTPDDQFAVVPSLWNDRVLVVNTNSMDVVAEVSLNSASPESVAMSPDGEQAAVGSCCAIDFIKLKGRQSFVAGSVDAFGAPRMEFSPSGEFLYAVGGQLYSIDAVNRQILTTAEVKGRKLALSWDGQQLYLAGTIGVGADTMHRVTSFAVDGATLTQGVSYPTPYAVGDLSRARSTGIAVYTLRETDEIGLLSGLAD